MNRQMINLAVFAVFVGACTSGVDDTTTTAPPPPTTSTTAFVTTSTQGTTTTAIPATTTTTIPGEPIDFGPRDGDVLMVVGVAHDDFLNLRALPGPDQEILDEIPPTFESVMALGETRNLPAAFWIKVSIDGTIGWVHMGFVAYMGQTDDSTQTVVDHLGEYPTADDMTALGLIVANVFASDEPESTVVVVVPESIGDLGEVTYDVIGIGDDAVRGFRIHVFGEPVTDGFSLKSAEVTVLCGRGITTDGLCP